MLQVEVPVHNVWRLQILIDAENVAWAAGIASVQCRVIDREDWACLTPVDQCWICAAEKEAADVAIRARLNQSARIQVQSAAIKHERANGRLNINNAEASTQDRFPSAEHVVCQTDTRRKIGVVCLVRLV